MGAGEGAPVVLSHTQECHQCSVPCRSNKIPFINDICYSGLRDCGIFIYEECGLVSCNAVQFVENPTFRRKMSPQS